MSDRLYVNERSWQRTVIDCARAYGWLTAHFRPAQNAKGAWRTPIEGDAKGFPDLVLTRDGRIIFAELKTDKGRVTPEQQRWLHMLALAAGPNVTVCVWRPRDWPLVEEELRSCLTLTQP